MARAVSCLWQSVAIVLPDVYPDGAWGTLQIHDRRLHNLKVQMHKLYKVKRATKATAI